MIKIDFGAPRLSSKDIPFDDGRLHDRIIDYPLMINRKKYPVTVVSMGNPHCAVFVDRSRPGSNGTRSAGRSNPTRSSPTGRISSSSGSAAGTRSRSCSGSAASAKPCPREAVRRRRPSPPSSKATPTERSRSRPAWVRCWSNGRRKGLSDRAGRIRLHRLVPL